MYRCAQWVGEVKRAIADAEPCRSLWKPDLWPLLSMDSSCLCRQMLKHIHAGPLHALEHMNRANGYKQRWVQVTMMDPIILLKNRKNQWGRGVVTFCLLSFRNLWLILKGIRYTGKCVFIHYQWFIEMKSDCQWAGYLYNKAPTYIGFHSGSLSEMFTSWSSWFLSTQCYCHPANISHSMYYGCMKESNVADHKSDVWLMDGCVGTFTSINWTSVTKRDSIIFFIP